MDRRQFLRGAGFIGLLAFLQACRLANFGRSPVAGVSTSLPANTATALPTFTPTATSTPFGLPAVSSPTATTASAGAVTAKATEVTPTPSPTGEVTPTPTPTPTPYPPGSPSKLGLFLTQYDVKALEMIAKGKPALVKTLEVDGNFVKGIKDSSPTTIVVGRIFLEQHNLDADPTPLVSEFVAKLLPLATDPLRMAGIDAWEAYNEPVADTVDKMKRLADFEAERTRILAENGIRSVVGNFGAGQPPLELWPEFRPALEAIRQYNGYLGLHEYSAPILQFRSGALQLAGEPDQGDEGWLTLRYRKVYRQQLTPMGFGDLPILITECGVDGLIQPRPGPAQAHGWQDFVDTWRANGLRDDPPGVYMDQLIWYDQNLQQDDYIKGAAIFLAGSNDGRWASYDILGPDAGRMGDLLQQYLEVHPPQA
ncbi:MAG: hypothetical protein HYR94_06350 [Chloroflexi bacterium]|nr:hypothetical protein [Chloroflexota bacterium]